MIKYFCDICKVEVPEDKLHKVYPDLMSREYVELCENCFQQYSKEMRGYLDKINRAEDERQEAIKKYFNYKNKWKKI